METWYFVVTFEQEVLMKYNLEKMLQKKNCFCNSAAVSKFLGEKFGCFQREMG